MGHSRLRRASPIAQYAVGAAFEALGADAGSPATLSSSLGIVVCAMSGCVNYSRRFYDETLKDPATASPLVFPETVFNAPASHLASLLGLNAINYTLVGDPGTFLQGIALAADWLLSRRVDGCLVIGAEESDWLTTEAYRLFDRSVIASEGAGAVYLRRDPGHDSTAQLRAVTDPHLFTKTQSRAQAAARARAELGPRSPAHVLCDGTLGISRLDSPEETAWSDWTGARLSPKKVLGEGLMAGAAWQCVAAIDALRDGGHPAAIVSIVGSNQQAIAAEFSAVTPLNG
jgi:3-oxoacyl-(acyl-carrier-protein) synthase